MYSPMNAKAANGKLEKLMTDTMYTAEIKYDGSSYAWQKSQGNAVN